MPRIVAVHSFRGGTGKSNLVANVAAILASEGRRVGVIDADIQSPGIHVLFGLNTENIKCSLNDYLWDKCPIEDAAQDVTPSLKGNAQVESANQGRVLLIPSSMNASEIARILHDGYDVDKFTDGLFELVAKLQLDLLLIDTHPGLNEETLLSMTIADVLLILLRPDEQDFQGTSVTVSVAQRLGVPNMLMVVNNTPLDVDLAKLQIRVEEVYGCKVAAVLPYSQDMLTLASKGIFALHYPDHAFTTLLRRVAAAIK